MLVFFAFGLFLYSPLVLPAAFLCLWKLNIMAANIPAKTDLWRKLIAAEPTITNRPAAIKK